jgi:putative cobalt transporter subunit CbtB
MTQTNALGTRHPEGVLNMTYAAAAIPTPSVAIPVGESLPWAIFAGLICLIAIYFVGTEQGATSLTSGMYVHEFVHDGRHLLGFPCH